MPTYTKKSIARPAGSPGRGYATMDELILIDVDDISTLPERDADGVTVSTTITLKPNAKAIKLYMTPGTVEATDNAEGEVDAVGFKPSIKGSHPGNSADVRAFKYNNLDKRFVILIRRCDGSPTDIVGDVCNPCAMTANYTGSKDANKNEFTFTQVCKGKGIGIYTPATTSIPCY